MQDALNQELYKYNNPLGTRYASKEICYIFSDQFKFSTWRKLWLALARAQKELGMNITDEQIADLEKFVDEIDFESAARYEAKIHHDVMSHIHAYGDQCPRARAVIHIGATSCYVTDNTDLIQVKEALKIISEKLQKVIDQLAQFASAYKEVPCLSYTHLQPAQPTTIGRRAILWLQDFLTDLEEIQRRGETLKFLGVKGATGTQNSFLELFDFNHDKVKKLEALVSKEMGFDHTYPVTGQTYPRKQDALILQTLSQLGITAHKFSTDFRLLASFKELEEPFGENQVGSSAMPYKRNPILSERISSLSRFLISLTENALYTASTQWLERTLDDSANRRLTLSQSFLCADAILELLLKVTNQIIVNKGIIQKRLEEELPFLATENLLMASVKKGNDRQQIHEILRKLSQEESKLIKEKGEENKLLEKIAANVTFKLNPDEIKELLKTDRLIGRSKEQVDEFLQQMERKPW